MRQIDETKLAGLHTAEELLGGKYGKPESESRKRFEDEARAFYYGEILRDRRKQLKMTQQQLADRVGTARSYIARVERGSTDIQMSNFFRIIQAMGMTLELRTV